LVMVMVEGGSWSCDSDGMRFGFGWNEGG